MLRCKNAQTYLRKNEEIMPFFNCEEDDDELGEEEDGESHVVQLQIFYGDSSGRTAEQLLCARQNRVSAVHDHRGWKTNQEFRLICILRIIVNLENHSHLGTVDVFR